MWLRVCASVSVGAGCPHWPGAPLATVALSLQPGPSPAAAFSAPLHTYLGPSAKEKWGLGETIFRHGWKRDGGSRGWSTGWTKLSATVGSLYHIWKVLKVGVQWVVPMLYRQGSGSSGSILFWVGASVFLKILLMFALGREPVNVGLTSGSLTN